MGVRGRRGRGQLLPDRRKGRSVPPEARGAAEARGPAAARASPEPSRTSPSHRPNLPEPSRAAAEPPRAAQRRVRAPDQLGARPESRGAHVEGHGALTMELSEYVQRGIQTLADPGSFDSNAFALLLRAAFQSLLDARADEAALDHPDLKHIDPVVLKHCHAAAATYILEAGKHQVDKSTLSTYLEDCKFDRERIELFCTEYQNNKNSLEILLGSIGRSLPHITDVSWRLEYQIKTNQLHKMYRPGYLVTLNVENSDSQSYPEISFSCNMEQLQDLVGKLKDASKSLERATQL